MSRLGQGILTVLALCFLFTITPTSVVAQDGGFPTIEQKEFGDWTYDHSADRFSNEELWISTTSDPNYDDAYGFAFVCYSDGTERTVLRLGFLGLASDQETKTVEWVIDNREPETHRFLVVTSGVGGTMLAAEGATFADRVRDGRMLHIRVETYNGGHESYSFPLNGASASLDAMPCPFDE